MALNIDFDSVIPNDIDVLQYFLDKYFSRIEFEIEWDKNEILVRGKILFDKRFNTYGFYTFIYKGMTFRTLYRNIQKLILKAFLRKEG